MHSTDQSNILSIGCDIIIKSGQQNQLRKFHNRFNQLENGEILDIGTSCEDYDFFRFLHEDFKKKFIQHEGRNIYSINI